MKLKVAKTINENLKKQDKTVVYKKCNFMENIANRYSKLTIKFITWFNTAINERVKQDTFICKWTEETQKQNSLMPIANNGTFAGVATVAIAEWEVLKSYIQDTYRNGRYHITINNTLKTVTIKRKTLADYAVEIDNSDVIEID